MTTALLQKMTTPHNINQAWRRYDTEKTAWRPGVRLSSVHRDMTYHLMTLAKDLESGVYRPEKLRRFTLLTASGKQRDLAALCLRDKVAQRAILQVLEPIAEKQMASCSYGYRPGRNTQMAYSLARTHISEGYHWLVHTDIKSFFDRVPLHRLKKFLKKKVPDKTIQEMLFRMMDHHATTKARPWRRARGIPQGGILSPLLGNWFLSQLDDKLLRKKMRFVRFADDIMICCKTRQEAERHLQFLEKQVKKLGLTLNPEKTEIAVSNKKMVYLGYNMPRVK